VRPHPEAPGSRLQAFTLQRKYFNSSTQRHRWPPEIRIRTLSFEGRHWMSRVAEQRN
jgi:hypothetical protein